MFITKWKLFVHSYSTPCFESEGMVWPRSSEGTTDTDETYRSTNQVIEEVVVNLAGKKTKLKLQSAV